MTTKEELDFIYRLKEYQSMSNHMLERIDEYLTATEERMWVEIGLIWYAQLGKKGTIEIFADVEFYGNRDKVPVQFPIELFCVSEDLLEEYIKTEVERLKVKQ